MILPDFSETFIERARRDVEFARLMLDHATTMFLNGEPRASRFVLQMLVKGSIGFEALAHAIATPTDNLQRQLSDDGNPTMELMASMFTAIGQHLGVTLHVQSVAAETKQAGIEASTQTRPDAA